ncbi:hypothetical protein [Fredinandcohnia sp. 179-A 10B2 NHS]|uniref:hypothetical protein n=1 Tax=Fredinandcohnia sp. 179-A 10B2 NHS TaxID=3235176 RepID=UPI0039A10BE2
MKNRNFINKNSIPFIILGIIHLFLLYRLIKAKKDKYKWMLLLTNIGLAYLFEYFVLNLWKAYRYIPKVMNHRYLDNILGAIMSQALFVPISATFLAVFKKGWKWKFGFTLGYFCIENLFLRLKVYKVNWWRPTYSFIFLNIYFVLSDVIYKLLTENKEWVLKTAHYFIVVVTDVNRMYVNAVRDKFWFGRGLFRSWNEHFIIAPLYSLVISLVNILFSSQTGMIYLPLNFLCNIVIDAALVNSGLLKVKDNYLLKRILSHLFMIGLSRTLYQHVDKNSLKGEINLERISNINID